MSGYDSISDYAFENFDIDDYEDYGSWLDAVGTDFADNGRAPLDKIFDSSDFNRLQEEFFIRKGEKEIEEEREIEEEEEEERIEIEKEEKEEKRIEKEERKKERVQTVEEIFIEPIVEIVKSVVGSFKRLFGR